ncbi:phosphopantetheine-binding protein [Streptomyces noursei]|uniref:phosphopantetheine-binding protein n=1 Tax=Streptomyces noursei TaxID=1971 RepID=UPI0030F285B3
MGCGVGLLALLLHDEVESYHGADFSESALRSARERLSPRVELHRRHAADFTGVPPRSRDTVVVNSVAQYFPDADYLSQVLEGAIDTTCDGGRVFLGDLRNKELNEIFHGAVELYRAPKEASAEDVRARAWDRLAMEKELLVSPGFFRLLATCHPRLNGVEIALKRGRHATEMNCFRYDVTLHVGPTPPERTPVEPLRLEWPGAEDLGVLLCERRPDAVVVAGVPNSRTMAHLRAWRRTLEGGITAGEVCAEPALAPEGIDPEFFPDWAEEHGYEATAGWWLDDGADGTYDLVLRRRGACDGVPASVLLGKDAAPDAGHADGEQAAGERAAAWFAPYVSRPYSQESVLDGLSGDESPTEIIQAVWGKVLGREDIDPDANFFDLGGNSLLLVHVLQQLRATVGPELQLVDLFQHASVNALARSLTAGEEDTAQEDQKSATDRRRAMRRQRARRVPGMEG